MARVFIRDVLHREGELLGSQPRSSHLSEHGRGPEVVGFPAEHEDGTANSLDFDRCCLQRVGGRTVDARCIDLGQGGSLWYVPITNEWHLTSVEGPRGRARKARGDALKDDGRRHEYTDRFQIRMHGG